MSDEKYVVVTTISSHRMRYCIPVSELQKINPSVPVEPETWAKDCVTCEEVKEFSQEWLGEQIIDAEVYSEEGILERFDSDNDYLSSWTREKKLEYIRNWKENFNG